MFPCFSGKTNSHLGHEQYTVVPEVVKLTFDFLLLWYVEVVLCVNLHSWVYTCQCFCSSL